MSGLPHQIASPGRGLVRDVVVIVAAGVVLGLVYNWLGLQSPDGWGLPWIGQDRLSAIMEMAPVTASAGSGSFSATASDDPLAPPPVAAISDDPLAPPTSAARRGAVPEIPDVGRPVPIDLGGLRQFVDAGAALLIDARDAHEFEEGHIPGALNLPYDEAVTDPARLESLAPLDRPIVVYCGGGTCEVSLNLANELYYSVGYSKVAVYMGGYPEWVEHGLEVETGAGVREGQP